MEDETAESLAGALTAQGFILQNLYAALLSREMDPIAMCQATGKEMLRQFTQLPVTNVDPVDDEAAARVTDHGAHHLERFWTNVEGRLRTISR